MIVRFGYVAMSMSLTNASPSHTMTAAQFEKLDNRNAAIRKLERISIKNIENCKRLIKHNAAHDIALFRLSSRLVPLAGHPLTEGWKWDRAIRPALAELGELITRHRIRTGFHPDHYTVLNTTDDDVFKRSLQVLMYHYRLLKGMNQAPRHRCVLHIGGKKQGVEKGLETFIERFQDIPVTLSEMLILENDDTNYTVEHALYLGEKLGVPFVFDLHHHDVNGGTPVETFWDRVAGTWDGSDLPVKIHISSPREHPMDKSHADYIDVNRIWSFLQEINGSVDVLDVMIEAKKKDEALFRLMTEIKGYPGVKMANQSSIEM
ncbi:UV DNA damage repair endonuclease UvsE [Bacillus sp. H-16]|uniref:UV DNA damage repair endonuclease UvsE n=1 Tax=Alteribacter salitolerans TaxID=2912333 RepID=UPI0019649DF7|nr:UV DNA damage repair endonuclease UvsE [Alteribacter salitolerans]MBM7095891.1 UV DNA damage repair endonuclease UvsE [Alteribacter salitolerans]